MGTAYGAARSADDPYASMPRRISYLIDPEGVIQRAYEVTDKAGHAGEVLSDLATLRAR